MSGSSAKKMQIGAFVFAAVMVALFFLGLLGLLYYSVKRSEIAAHDGPSLPLIEKPKHGVKAV